jgi:hypothetical protein
MLERLIDFVCGNENVAFESEFDLETSVRRLAAEVKPPLAGFRPFVSGKLRAVVGNVSEQRVSLWCETQFVRNGLWSGMFIGNFQTIDGRVLLVGKMGLPRQIFIFFGAALGLMLIPVIPELIKNPRDPALWVAILFTLFGVLFLVGCARFFKWLLAGDERWLLIPIRSALCPNSLGRRR